MVSLTSLAFCVLALFSIVDATTIPLRHMHHHKINLRPQHSQRRRPARLGFRSDVNSTSSDSTILVNTSPKYVIAHHMVGNTYPYTLADWLDDIVQAHNAGIDGFALNTGSDDWQPARIADA